MSNDGYALAQLVRSGAPLEHFRFDKEALHAGSLPLDAHERYATDAYDFAFQAGQSRRFASLLARVGLGTAKARAGAYPDTM